MADEKDKKKIVGEEPTAVENFVEYDMGDAPEESEGVFEFPIGIVSDGKVCRKFTIRELTGNDEEAIGDEATRNNAGKFLTSTLLLCISNIEGIGKPTTNHIRSLLLGDRNFALMMLRRVSVGNLLDMTLPCPNCGHLYQKEVDIDEIEIRRLADDGPRRIKVKLSRGYTDKEKVTHKEIILRYPDGAIQEKLSAITSKNPSLGGTALITACTEKLGTLKHVDTSIIRALSKRDRDFIAMKLLDSPGPDLRIKFECPKCEQENSVPFDMTNFFVSK